MPSATHYTLGSWVAQKPRSYTVQVMASAPLRALHITVRITHGPVTAAEVRHAVG